MPAGPFSISVRADTRKVAKALSDMQKKQLPFAFARALTSVATRVQVAEKAALPKIFDRPTPFTINSIGVKAALTSRLQAQVFVKDIAASYLMPYEFGGNHKLPGAGRTVLNPKDRTILNQYGNLPRDLLTRFAGRSDMFVGTVKTKAGVSISGLWQRPFIRKNQKVRGRSVVRAGSNTTGKLKLIVRFGDSIPVKQHLDFRLRGQAIAQRYFKADFEAAIRFALNTAK